MASIPETFKSRTPANERVELIQDPQEDRHVADGADIPAAN